MGSIEIERVNIIVYLNEKREGGTTMLVENKRWRDGSMCIRIRVMICDMDDFMVVIETSVENILK